jgi:hypothetical protein
MAVRWSKAIVIGCLEQSDLATRRENFNARINRDGSPLLGAGSVPPHPVKFTRLQGHFRVSHNPPSEANYNLVP